MAIIEFGSGLNVLFGASNTGKSFIVDTIDFMLGGKGPLRDIPERVGYNQILLALETLDDEKFTIVRSPEGGAFRLYTGLYSNTLPEGEGTILANAHNDKKDDNLSAFLLSKLDLAHKRVRKNSRNETQSLSFRNIARLLIINEEEIIQQRSPLSDGNVIADTTNTSAFKFMLTGVDDSALASAQARSPEEQSRSAQIELLDELIDGYQRQVKELAGQKDELEEQRDKLNLSMESQGELLSISETAFKEAATTRRGLAKRVEEGRNRLAEITALLERFILLDVHYRSDIARLQAIEEAGSLFGVLDGAACPLCGAEPEHHRLSDNCDGNIDKIVAAARVEITKIKLRQVELATTISTLRKEAVSFGNRLPRLEDQLSKVCGQIDKVVAPNLRQLRTTYRQLADKDGEVREALALYRQLEELEERKTKLELENESLDSNVVIDVSLSTSTVDKFAGICLDILKAWHFPEIDRLHFDMKTRDLVINGKSRISYGKGLRAITQAAFTVGLLEFCRENETPHPGFVVLDSPLLSYKAPDDRNDDLSNTDLKDQFYVHLSNLKADRQILIVENTDPPLSVQELPQAVKFTGIPGLGRAGYFPPEKSQTE
jgi:DNA repair exonuclease SbcCD ATPase subunit